MSWLALGYTAGASVRHAKQWGEVPQSIAATAIERANVVFLFHGQRNARLAAKHFAALRCCVAYVVRVCAQKEVAQIATARVIAAMQNVWRVFGNGTIGLFPNRSVRQNGAIGVIAKMPVPGLSILCSASTRPDMTRIDTSRTINACMKSLGKREIRPSWHGSILPLGVA